MFQFTRLEHKSFTAIASSAAKGSIGFGTTTFFALIDSVIRAEQLDADVLLLLKDEASSKYSYVL